MSPAEKDPQPEAPSNAETPANEGAGPSPGASVEDLSKQLQDAEEKLAAAKDLQLRTVAEMDNLRKRLEREAANAGKYGAEKLLSALLGVADSLDLGLAAAAKPDAEVPSLIEGMELTRKQMVSVLEKNGVKPLDSQGKPFNPDFHEAMAMVPSAEVPPNHIIEVVQKGYTLHERLLRPAMVVVAKAAEGAPPAGDKSQDASS